MIYYILNALLVSDGSDINKKDIDVWIWQYLCVKN